MSFFSGYNYFFTLAVLLLPSIILGLFQKNIRWYRIALSLIFIYLVYRSSIAQMIYLVSYVILSTIVVKAYLILRTKYGRNSLIYGIAILVAILPLIIYKVSLFFDASIFGFLGLSYICFRVVQVVIETYDGVINNINIIQFIEFLIFFPSLSSGPIDRSRRFNEDDNKTWTRSEYIELFTTGIYKIVLGAFYKFVCSAIFFNILETNFVGRYKPLYLLGYAYTYGLYMFFDFAGYSAMAIGTAYILGIRLPENFNKPFLSIDIKDFWNRWHISLSSWFRDFIFSRFMIDSARKKRFSNRLTGAVIGLILNMTIMGVWHGITLSYIAYGLYHGCILAFVEVYQKKSSFYKKNKKKKWYITLSWFVNLNVVMFGFLVFSGQLETAFRAII